MIILILTLYLTAAPQGQAWPADLYNQGNACYVAGDYQGAIDSYLRALERTDHPQLRYNLGNAYFKSGRMGMAVIQYRRARALAPRDPDIAHNLEFVRDYRVDKASAQPGPLEQALARAFTFFSGREAALLAAACFLTAALLVAWFLLSDKRWPLVLASLAIVGWGYFLIVSQVWRAERGSHPAVVTAKEVGALSGPGQDFKEILLLHDGTEVRIREKRGDYLLVQLPGGLGGWVPQGAVEPIYR